MMVTMVTVALHLLFVQLWLALNMQTYIHIYMHAYMQSLILQTRAPLLNIKRVLFFVF